jgi:hypothetical protein
MPSHFESQFALRYHVPRSQVWEGSRGKQIGAVHLHAIGDVELTAKIGRSGRLVRKVGQALCGRRGWYERDVEHESDLRVECSECKRRARRYGIPWPLDHDDGRETPQVLNGMTVGP